MADTVQTQDRYVITLGPDASAEDVEAANARANNREPQPLADATSASEDAAPPQDVDQGAEQATEDAELDEAMPAKPTRADKRIRQLVQQRNAEREARIRMEERLAALEQRLTPEPAIPQPPARPDRDEYDDEDAYIEAVTDWKIEQRMGDIEARRDAVDAAREEAREMASAQDREAEAIRQAATRHDDFLETLRVADSPSPLLDSQLQALFPNLDEKADVLYHLATHPEELATLNASTNPLGVAERLIGIQKTLRSDTTSESMPDTAAHAATEAPTAVEPPARGLQPLSGNAEPGAGAYDPYRDGVPNQQKYREWYEKTYGRPRYK